MTAPSASQRRLRKKRAGLYLMKANAVNAALLTACFVEIARIQQKPEANCKLIHAGLLAVDRSDGLRSLGNLLHDPAIDVC